ncbi:hypothetical protein BgiMline_029743, partial [Biomphalaria glabrata]
DKNLGTIIFTKPTTPATSTASFWSKIRQNVMGSVPMRMRMRGRKNSLNHWK